MSLITSSKRLLATLLIISVGTLGSIAPVMAGMVSTDDLVASETLDDTRTDVLQLLESESVANALAERGVDVDAAKERVASLTQPELEQLAQHMDAMPAGEGALGTIAMILFILILLDIAGITDIFPGV